MAQGWLRLLFFGGIRREHFLDDWCRQIERGGLEYRDGSGQVQYRKLHSKFQNPQDAHDGKGAAFSLFPSGQVIHEQEVRADFLG